MAEKLDPLALAGAKAKGKRPWFLDNTDAERVLNITLVLMQEVAVMRERLDTIERLLERDGNITREAIEAFEPSKQEADERGLWQQEFIARCLRILQQDREALTEGKEASSEEVAEEFAEGG
ncbi:hypothetical protein GCM10007148_03600 [Parvularcula lutaonensis]|nr:hypothetical protein GCM10007148_03600 [Parvularcula lutaonensis]